MNSQETPEPYRIFFPMGWLLGLGGVLIWIPWFTGGANFYPGLSHPTTMIGGFLILYAVGFLTTAIPRFTATPPMTTAERVIGYGLGISLIPSAFSGQVAWVYAADLALLIFTTVFGMRRFLRRQSDPPPSFLFLGAGLVLGILGSATLYATYSGIAAPEYSAWGKTVFNDGFMLALVLGAGTRLIPALLGHQPIPTPKGPGEAGSNEPRRTFINQIPRPLIYLAATFIGSFFVPPQIGLIFRSAVTSFVAAKYWKILNLPIRRGPLPYAIWASSWLLVIGQLGSTVFAERLMNIHHLFYVSGYGLLTLMISTRVTLSHSGEDLTAELKSKNIALCGSLVIVASILRLVAGWMSTSNAQSLMLLAAGAWSMALLLWIIRFGKLWGPRTGSV